MTVERIEVYCQAPSHDEKRWRVGAFECGVFDGVWRIDDHDAHGGDRQTLIGNRRLPRVMMGDEVDVDTTGSRDRYPLRCRLCGDEKPVADGSPTMERLQAMLGTLAAAGVSEISLTALRANL